MKVDTKVAPPAFAARQLTITFETQDELDAFGTLFNHVGVAKALREVGFDSEAMYRAAQSIGGNIYNRNLLWEGLRRHYSKLP